MGLGALLRGAGYTAGRLAGTSLYKRYFGKRRGYPKIRRGSYIPRGYGGAIRAGRARTRGVYGVRASSKYDVNTKYVDYNASYIVNTGPATTLVNGIAAGTSVNQRIGNRIRMNRMVWNMRFYPQTVPYDPDNNFKSGPIRFLMAYDKQANGVLADLTDVLDSSDTMSNVNENNRQRFIILYDKIINQPIVAAASDGSGPAGTDGPVSWTNKVHRCTIPIGLMTQYNETSSFIDAITSGSLLIWIFNDVANVTSHNIVADVQSRLYYHG